MRRRLGLPVDVRIWYVCASLLCGTRGWVWWAIVGGILWLIRSHRSGCSTNTDVSRYAKIRANVLRWSVRSRVRRNVVRLMAIAASLPVAGLFVKERIGSISCSGTLAAKLTVLLVIAVFYTVVGAASAAVTTMRTVVLVCGGGMTPIT